MKSYIRKNRGIKISRDISYLSSRLNKLTELLTQKYRRFPTVSELSKETNIPEWKIIEALGIRNCIQSIDNELPLMGSTSIDGNLELEDMFSTLDSHERRIISERYFQDKSQNEVAVSMGFSQAKVSRYEKKIIKKLRNYFKTS